MNAASSSRALLCCSVVVLLLAVFISDSHAAIVPVTGRTLSAFSNGKTLPVLFVTKDQCRRCDELRQALEQLSTSLVGKVEIGSIDGEKESAVAKKLNVKDFPSLVLFRNGEGRVYQGSYVARNLQSFLDRYSAARVLAISDKASKKNYIDSDEFSPRVVGYFSNSKSADYERFASVAALLTGPTKFYSVSDEKLAKSMKLKQTGQIVYFAPLQSGEIYDGDRLTQERLVAFMTKEDASLLPQIRVENQLEHSFAKGITYTAIVSSNDKNAERLIKTARAAFRKVKGDQYHYLWAAVEMYPDLMSQFSMTSDDLPTIVGVDSARGKFFSFSKLGTKWSDKNIEQFVRDFAAGKLVRSQPRIPEAENSGPVRVLTANAFDEDIMQSNKHALVEFYAPWCGHCKKLEPIFDQVALHFKNISVDDVIIAKMDATENDPRAEYGVTGFPTLIYIPPQNPASGKPKKFEKYTGPREFADLVKFIEDKKEGRRKSEPIPAADSNNGPVRVLVADSFDAEVLQTERAAFVEFYAPWCGHCKALTPTWEKLGEQFRDSNVLVAKIDATANEIDGTYDVKGFPTLIFFPAGLDKKTEYVPYNGARDFDALAAFVREQISGTGAGKEEL